MSNQTSPNGEQETVSHGIRVDFAKQFLTLLAGESPVTFQTIPESSEAKNRKHLARVFHGSADEHFQTLIDLNLQGAGIFVMVNEGDGITRPGEKTCRTKSNVKRVRALVVDLDGAPIDPLLVCNARPHAIVETSPGRWHGYWKVSDCPLDRFSGLQAALAQNFDGDPSVTDISRVMRLPGFLHQKSASFASTLAMEYGGKLIKLATPAQPYTVQELITSFGLNTPILPKAFNDSVSAGPQAGLTIAGDESLDIMRPCGDGERTKHLTRMTGILLSKGISLPDVLRISQAWNETNTLLLPRQKVLATCQSIYQTHRRNHPDRSQTSVSPVEPLFTLSDARIDIYLETEPPERRWAIPGLLPAGIVGAVVAPGGTGKSVFLLQLAIAKATASTLVNQWEVAEAGPVLCLFTEDDPDEIHRRLRRIVGEVGTSWDDATRDRLRNNLHIVSRVGEDNLLTDHDQWKGGVKRTATADRLMAAIAQRADWSLIILDPTSRFRGGDENSARDTTSFVEVIERIRKLSGATLILAQHAGKAGGDGGQHAQRGSSALTDGIRWQVHFKAIDDNDRKRLNISPEERSKYIEAKLVKTNYTAPMSAVILRRSDEGVLWAVKEDGLRSYVELELTEKIRAIIRREKFQNQTFTRTSFERKYGGREGELGIGKVKLRQLLVRFIAEGKLFAAKQRLLCDKPIPS